MAQPTVTKRTAVVGFDPLGEPEIRDMSDGTVCIVFNFMPPSFEEGNEARFADFDKQLEKALEVPVLWEDRETFVIRKPTADTVKRASAFLQSFRKKGGK